MTRPAPRATARSAPSAPTSRNAFEPQPHVRGWVGQLQPVELGLLARRVLDHRHRPALGRAARLARRAQPAGPQLAGERRIGAVVAQLEQLVEQRGRPQMRVLAQPFAGSSRRTARTGPARPGGAARRPGSPVR